VTRQLGGETETIESGFIEFETARTFRHELHFSVQTATGSEPRNSINSGIWVQYPDAVQLNYTGSARAVIGRLSGNRVTIDADGDRYVFEK
jgi:hypothetical protein